MKASETSLKLPHRPLGKTGLSISEIGFGGWGIGKSMWGPTDDHESMRALHAALESGVDYFDTAYAYGHGHSERLIARLFKEAGRRAAVSTKVPPKNMEWPGHPRSKLAAPAPEPPAGARHRRLPRPKWVLIIAVFGMFVSVLITNGLVRSQIGIDARGRARTATTPRCPLVIAAAR